MFLNDEIFIIDNKAYSCFRPLSGSYVSQSGGKKAMKFLDLFPSPVGELCFSIFWTCTSISEQLRVSVPCRGAMFLNHRCFRYATATTVSVPCRGAMFLNSQEPLQVPLRGSSFRPLSGSYVSQSQMLNYYSFGTTHVSVPCRGAMFLNPSTTYLQNSSQGFRPLSGSYVSQL